MILLKVLGIVALILLGMVVVFVAFINLMAYIGEKFGEAPEKTSAEIAKWEDRE